MGDNTSIGDRMKQYEGIEARRTFIPGLPICARIDGRGFSRFTRGFEKPFDMSITTAMHETTKYLVEETHADIGYTQSDEISLVFVPEAGQNVGFFAGRIQKLTSVLASMATVKFNHVMMESHEEIVRKRMPLFDARVWQVPSMVEAMNTLLWRAQDARKNGISAACRAMFSTKQMFGKSQADMIEMMAEAGCDYESDYPWELRLGVFFRRELFPREIEDEVWNAIPEKTRATMERVVTRSRVVPLGLNILDRKEDRLALLFPNTPVEG